MYFGGWQAKIGIKTPQCKLTDFLSFLDDNMVGRIIVSHIL